MIILIMKLPLKNINYFYKVAYESPFQDLLKLIYAKKALNKQFLAFRKSNCKIKNKIKGRKQNSFFKYLIIDYNNLRDNYII